MSATEERKIVWGGKRFAWEEFAPEFFRTFDKDLGYGVDEKQGPYRLIVPEDKVDLQVQFERKP